MFHHTATPFVILFYSISSAHSWCQGTSTREICEMTELDADAAYDLSRLHPSTTTLALKCGNHSGAVHKANISFKHLVNLYRFESLNCQFPYITDSMFPNSSQITYFSIESSKNIKIDGTAFCNLQYLRELRIIRSNFKEVPNFCHCNQSSDCSLGLQSLEVLDLTDNELHTLPENVYAQTPRLAKLIVKGNRISSIHPPIHNISSLAYFDASNNNLESIPEGLFSRSESIMTIILSGNPINMPLPSFLRSESFYANIELSNMDLSDRVWNVLMNISVERLDLSVNKLAHVPDEFLNQHLHLRYLDLSYNKLCSWNRTGNVGGIASSHDLRYLDLHNNDLSSLSNHSLSVFRKLDFLDLSSNRLTTIEGVIFDGLVSFKTLNVSNNKLGNIPNMDGIKSSLYVLDLANNVISGLAESSFPVMPILIGISLKGNNLTYLAHGAFQKLPNVIVINLKNNSVELMEVGVFSDLWNLKFVDLSRNSITDVSGVFSHTKITWLDLSRNRITVVRRGDYPITMETLALTWNNIKEIESLAFYDLLHLQVVWLALNLFRWLSSVTFLTPHDALYRPTFHIRGNILKCDCKMHWLKEYSMRAHLRGAIIADADETFCYTHDIGSRVIFRDFPISNFVCSYTNSTYTDRTQDTHKCPNKCNCTYSNDRQVQIVTCDNLDLENIPVLPTIATHIYMRNNAIREIREDAFANLTRLVHLDLSGNKIEILRTGIFRDLAELQFLMLNSSCIRAIDNSSFEGLNHLRALYLQDNMVGEVEGGTFDHLTNLKQLYIDNNNISVFQPSLADVITHVDEISLYDNPWICHCDTVEDFQVLMINFSKAIVGANDTHCTPEHCNGDCSNASYVITNFPIGKLCTQRNVTYVTLSRSTTTEDSSVVAALSASFIFVLLITAVIIIVVRKRDLVQVWAYSSFGWRIFDRRRRIDDVSMKYDAFVSYSSKDEDFIVHQLAPTLEDEHPNYRLCLHYRDFPIGAFITETIVESISDSKRTIMVLSNSFLESEWCHLEFQTAHRKVLQDRTNRLIVIILSDIDQSLLDDDLKLYLKTKTYLRFDDPWFWNKLRFAMPDMKVKGKDEICEDTV